MLSACLYLKNGTVFAGFSPAWQKGEFFGEVVFTTGMTGYVETLTDPSYKDQIIVFTYPLIGNYGVPTPRYWESKKIHAAGVVVGEAGERYSHHTAEYSLLQWLRAEQVPLLTGVDTRALTKTIREHGTMLGKIGAKTSRQTDFPPPHERNLVAEVTISKKRRYGAGRKKIIVVDCGMKENSIRSLLRFPVTIERVPYDYDYTREKFDGLFISNGPGDPTQCTATIAILKKAFQLKKPIFGICLGSQLLSLAAGATTYKLPFGHRGQNQPCQEIATGRCTITSQNHGYAVNEKTLPPDWQVSFRNLNDGSAEGAAHKKLPFFSVQFHPEGAPGPTDTEWLFENFYKLL